MQGIDILINEHEKILEFCDVVKAHCLKDFEGETEVDTEFYSLAIEFGKKFIDGHHHKKEEDILFEYLKDKVGGAIIGVIDSGMMFDHNMGRAFVMDAEYAISSYKAFGDAENKYMIVSSIFEYVHMMENHITKENEVLYPFAENNFNSHDAGNVDTLIVDFENEAQARDVQGKCFEILNRIQNY